MSISASENQQGLDDFDVADVPIERAGRSADPEDFGQKGRGRKAGGRPAPEAGAELEAGTEVNFWPSKGVYVPANVVRNVGGGKIDLVYRLNGLLRPAESVEHRAAAGGWSWPGEMPESDEPMAGGKPVRVGARAAFYVGRSDQPKQRFEGRILLRRESDGAVYILRDGFEISRDLGLDEKTLPSAPGVYLVRTYGHNRNQWVWPDDPAPKPVPSTNRPGARGRSTRSGEPLGAGKVGVFLSSSRSIVGPKGQHHTKDGSTPVAELTPEEANELLEWLRCGYRLRGPNNIARLLSPS
jgi:hypothetical protein